MQMPVIEAQEMIGNGAHLADGDGLQVGTEQEIIDHYYFHYNGKQKEMFSELFQ